MRCTQVLLTNLGQEETEAIMLETLNAEVREAYSFDLHLFVLVPRIILCSFECLELLRASSTENECS